MHEPIIRIAERLNKLSMNFQPLHAQIYEDTGPDMTSGARDIQIPILSYRNHKLQHAAIKLHAKAGYDDKGAYIAYGASTHPDVYIVRDTSGENGMAYLSLFKGVTEPVRDEQGRNTPPYLKFGNEVECLRLATQNVTHLLASWYASLLTSIGDHGSKS